MTEVAETKADSAVTAPAVAVVKKAAKKKVGSKGVAVKNISNRVINTSKGCLKPGEDGYASEAEARQLHRFLETI